MRTHEKIRRYRKEFDLSQRELAELLHVTLKTVSRWETGLCMPAIHKLRDMADLFDVDVTKLLSDRKGGAHYGK